MNAGFKAWVEAMRLRTLPVSVSGVLAGAGCAAYTGRFNTVPFILCMLFAVMAQIVSNFANEYFDWRNGLDRKGREGFRRGVTEGDIRPRAMRNATIGLMALTCCVGLPLIWWGGWWLVFVGLAVALFAFAYSAGPWPLSHHGLGEAAVVLFFGLVPVIFTAWVMTGNVSLLRLTVPVGFAIGLMGANVMIVNNYRDYYDDRQVGKHTLAVIIGRRPTLALYIVNSFLALLLIETAIITLLPWIWQIPMLAYINGAWVFWRQMGESEGRELNPLLGKTAFLMLAAAIYILVALAINHVA